MKILITGGAGFIAKNLTEQLRDEYNIVSQNSKELNLLDTTAVYDYIKNNHFDIVVHTATYDAAPKHSSKDPEKVLENNLKMFFNVARCNSYFDKMIYFGSGAEFGREHWKPKMEESYFDQHVPTDQYGLSKYIMTKHALVSTNIYNLRIFGLFGKYDDWRTRFIPNACCHAALNLPIRINQNIQFDNLYIDDLVGIVKIFINNKPLHKVYNICSGLVFDFKTLAEKILKIAGKDLEIIIKNEGVGKEYSGNNSLLINEFKSINFTRIDDSLRSLYKWHELHKNILHLNL